MDTDDRTWKVGELAEATGLSVRTLHHYDEIGLLRPSGRSTSGHRQYDAADVRRLHLIVAVRGFGLSLTEVGQVLDGELTDPGALFRAQLDLVEEQLTAAAKVKRMLLGVLDGLDRAREPSPEGLIELIEGMTAMSRVLTRDEVAQLTQGRQEAMANLSEAELAALVEERRKATEALTPEQREAMAKARAEMMPTD
ncbi:MerR family transcriptional regulator [Kribbella sp. NPDC051952]|uniref:MerR family transcriptional regulator n=1 Tax=Kribbella sp. NPDC051952 TaxID=3154851 RepID=UPI0034244A9D